MSDSSSGTVKFVLSMKNKQNFKSSYKFWMRFERLLIEFIKHVKEVFNISELFRWKVEVSSDSMTIRVGSDGGNVSQYFVNLFVSYFFVFINCFSDKTRVLLRVKG